MIGKVSRGSDVGGLLRYLFGPGLANEHVDPHLVASWLGDDPVTLADLEPTMGDGRPSVMELAARLSLSLQLDPDVDRPVWQCSMRTASTDRQLTDQEWAQIARDVVHRTGLAPDGDPGGCRWVAVRHASDHIHVAVILARQDGARATVFRDWPKVHAAARAAELRYGLQAVDAPARTATVAPSRGEVERAARRGETVPARAWLARATRLAAASGRNLDEFTARLETAGVLISWRHSTRNSGERTGYSVGRPGDVDAEGRQIWFSGSRLAPDLSLPRLRERWSEADGDLQPTAPTPRRGVPRREVLQDVETGLRKLLDGAGDVVIPAGDLPAFADLALVLAHRLDTSTDRRVVRAAEMVGEDLRAAARQPPATGGAWLGVAGDVAALGRLTRGEVRDALVLLAHLVRLAHITCRPNGSPAALAAAAASQANSRKPSAGIRGGQGVGPRLAALVHETLPSDVAHAVLGDPAWPLVAADLARAGDGAGPLLRAAASRRELLTARSVAAVLHHRLLVYAPQSPRARPAPQADCAAAPRPNTRAAGRPRR